MNNLNMYENAAYQDAKKNILPMLPKKTIHYFCELFPGRETCARIAKKLFEEISNGKISGVRLVGSRMRDGFIII